MGNAQLKAGEVVRIRVSPTDVMAVIDVVDAVGMYVPGMSLAQCVSIALRATLENCRHSKVIPTRDGFEYSAMLSRFPTERSAQLKTRARALDITQNFERGLGESGRVTGLANVEPEPQVDQELLARMDAQPDYENHPNLSVRRIYREMAEMIFRKDVDPDNFDTQRYELLHSELQKLTANGREAER